MGNALGKSRGVCPHPAIVTCSPWRCCCLRNNACSGYYWPGGESSFLNFVPSFSQIIHFAQLIHWLLSTSSVRKESLLLAPTAAVTWGTGRDLRSCSKCSDRLTLSALPWVSHSPWALTAPAQRGVQRLKTGWNYVIMWIPPNKTMPKYVVNIGRYVCTLKLSIHSVDVYINAEEQD